MDYSRHSPCARSPVGKGVDGGQRAFPSFPHVRAQGVSVGRLHSNRAHVRAHARPQGDAGSAASITRRAVRTFRGVLQVRVWADERAASSERSGRGSPRYRVAQLRNGTRFRCTAQPATCHCRSVCPFPPPPLSLPPTWTSECMELAVAEACVRGSLGAARAPNCAHIVRPRALPAAAPASPKARAACCHSRHCFGIRDSWSSGAPVDCDGRAARSPRPRCSTGRRAGGTLVTAVLQK